MNILTRWALNRPWPWILVGLVLTVGAAAGLFRLNLRTDGASLHPPRAREVLITQRDKQLFGEPERVLVLVSCRNDNAPGLDTQEGLLFLEQVHDELLRLEQVSGVVSLVTELDTPAQPNLRCLPTYLDSVPTSDWNFHLLLKRIRSQSHVTGLLLSEDGRFATLPAAMKDGVERSRFVAILQNHLESLNHDHWQLTATGPVLAETTLGTMVLKDLARLVPVMIFIMTLVLLMTLRTISALVLTMLEVAVVLVWSIGLMGWLDIPITLVTTILPVILMTMAVTDEIHFLERFQSLYARTGNRRESARDALKEVGPPIILTSITTAVGFLSFLTAQMVPIRDFGLFTALGILLAMLLTFTLIPALLMVLPARAFRPLFAARKPRLVTYEHLLLHPKAILMILVSALIGIWGVTRLEVQDSWVRNFNPQSPMVKADTALNQSFWGSYRYDLVLEAGDGWFHTPEGVSLARDLTEWAVEGPRVGGVMSYLTSFDKIRSLQKDRDKPYDDIRIGKVLDIVRIAGDRMGIFELMNKQGSVIRLQLFVSNADYRSSKALHDWITTHLPGRLPDNVVWRAGGDLPVALAVVGGIVSNQLSSIAQTIVGISLLLILFSRDRRRAPLIMIPVLVTVFLVAGGMGAMGMDLGIATSMFAALTIGAGVDFAIHFAHGYRLARERSGCHQDACIQTIAGTGRALRWNAAILATGFLVLTLSSLKPNHQLGFLLASGIVSSYLTTIVLMPILLNWSRDPIPKK